MCTMSNNELQKKNNLDKLHLKIAVRAITYLVQPYKFTAAYIPVLSAKKETEYDVKSNSLNAQDSEPE